MKNKRRLRRAVSGVLCVTLTAALCVGFLFNSGTAQAVTSLPHIVEILGSQTTFNVLEVVPQAGAGSLGYYVKGQEPFGSWEKKFSESATALSRDERSAYANSLLSGLSGSGLLSRAGSTPLTYSGSPTNYSYTERYYWELGSPSGWTPLTLSHPESVTVTGTFTAGSGHYKGQFDYVFDPTGGDYVQVIDYFFVPGSGGGNIGSYYYYQPAFGEVTPENFMSPEVYGHAVYTNTQEDGTGSFVYYDVLDENASLNMDVKYYYVISAGAPTAASAFYDSGTGTYTLPAVSAFFDSATGVYTVSGYYAAQSGAFAETDSDGYFDSSIIGYQFDPNAGSGSGSYSFTPDASGTPATVTTSTVYYMGTVSNNDWFLKSVFDVATPNHASFTVKVQTVTPAQLTKAMITGADLIVLSAGFNPAMPGTSLAHDYFSNDITSALAFEIYKATLSAECPLIVDYRLTGLSDSLNITRLAKLCLTPPYNAAITAANFSTYAFAWNEPANRNYAAGNVLCFNSPFTYSDPSTIPDLATAKFTAVFSADAITGGFSAVLAEIQNENFLRKVDAPSTSDLLPENVTLANAMRYIINYSGQRIVTSKASIKVLDLEPGNAGDGKLSTATVLSWLGGSGASPYDADDITITTMSTAEFIGKIEDINETYDLVYIGTCLDGFNTTTSGGVTTADYNDETMDGLIYANIGDTYRSSTDFRGLLARDNTDLKNLFRFSGNDITPSKVQELSYFAQGGYPVVIANDIFLPTVSSTTTPFAVNVTASVSNTTVTLSASAVDSASGQALSATYKWYRTGSATVQSTNATYSFTASDGTNSYYCVATAASNPATDARSKTITVSGGAGVSFVIDTSTASSGSYTGPSQLQVSVTPTSGAISTALTATATGAGSNTVTYRWYKSGTSDSIATGSTYVPSTSGNYYCRASITIPGYGGGTYTARSNTVTVSVSSSNDTGSKTTPSYTATNTLSVSISRSGSTLTATVTVNGTVITSGITYRWYYSSSGDEDEFDQISGATSSMYSVPGNGYYYCRASITVGSTTYRAFSNTIRRRNGPTWTNDNTSIVSPTYTVSNTLSIDIAYGSGTLTTTVSGTGSYAPSYQWYYKAPGGSTFSAITGETASAYTPEAYGYYYCTLSVTATPTPARSNTRLISAEVTNNNNNAAEASDSFSTTVYFNVNLGTPTANGNSVTLSASAVIAGTSTAVTGGTYRWYRTGSSTSLRTGSSYTFDADIGTNSYYCVFSPGGGGSVNGRSGTVQVTRGEVTATIGTGQVSGAYYQTEYLSSGDINSARVDNKSYVHSAISQIKGRANVMSVSEIDAGTLRSYLNLSKPKIVFANASCYPTVYSNTGGVMTSLTATGGVYYLNYTFTIQNENDPTPATTTYDCRLYLDLNADGRYSDEEKLDDITVRRGGALVYTTTSAEGDEYYRLSAGVTYSVSRQVPTQYAGILPWQLEVVKNNAERIHASVHNYTRIAPATKQPINILQISADTDDDVLNLQAQQVSSATGSNSQLRGTDNRYYAGIYGKLLADVADFNVTITTKKAATLENRQFGTFTPPASATTNAAKIYSYLDQFDMVIIGFNDCYSQIQQNTATAITQYIASGKSILFTHDTTSFYNTDTGWGYYFNTIIRDTVGLDRYGITSASTVAVGGTPTIKSLLYPGAALTAAQQTAIAAKNYSIAYDAKTTATPAATVPETHGFTNYELIRYGQSGQLKYTTNTYSSRETQYVSQVNEGQITTYPYNINTAAFSAGATASSPNYMSVLTTHEQYYQLNMNRDDIVVWYCLASDPNNRDNYYYDDLPNDAVNAYYIFNRGNVTYSGVGHTSASSHYTGSSVSTAAINESKLFVNTMIAAYQSGKTAPTVKITSDASGDDEIKYMYFHADYTPSDPTDTVSEAGMGGSNPMRIMYFVISDANLDADKVIKADFYYNANDGNGDILFGTSATPVSSLIPIYQTNTQPATSLKGGKVYYIYLPNTVLAMLGPDNVNAVTLKVRVTTTIGTAARYGETSIELRKIGLFDLC